MLNKDALFSELKSTGEKSVREKLAQGVYGPGKTAIIQEWLRQCEEERLADATSRAEAREEESLSISRNALKISNRANIIAIIAIILSAATAIAIAVIEFKSKTP